MMVSCHDLSAGYGGRIVLRSIDCEFAPGSVTGIIGPNGAGKTTLLKTLNRTVRPTKGRITIDGEDLARLAPRRISVRISFAPQMLDLHFEFTVREVVLFGRYPHIGPFASESRTDIEKTGAAMDAVGLSGFEDRIYGELSTGEKKLVVFAKTLAQDADVVLCDEPFSGLDIAHAERLVTIIRGLAESGKTVIISVHELDIASRACSRLLLLAYGTIAATGRPEDVLTPGVLDPVYGVNTSIVTDPRSGTRFVSAHSSRSS